MFDEAEGIEEDINALGKNVSLLRELVSKLATDEDSSGLRDELRLARDEAQDMAIDLRDRLNDMPLSQRLEKARLVKEFTGVLKEYQAVQNESIRKERIILSDMQKKLDEDEKKASGREAGDPYQFSLDEMGVEQIGRTSLVEHNTEIKEIEANITRIGELFKDMHTIVEDATPQLDAIAGKMSHTLSATEEATTSLSQSLRAVVLARWKKLLIGLVLLVVLLLVIVIIIVVVAVKT
jgi:t-SNARE complex subunit (syntaxin)